MSGFRQPDKGTTTSNSTINDESSWISNCLENKAILAKILSNIRPQLQDYRLVNHKWNEAVLRILPKRVKLSFNFEPMSYLHRRDHFEAQVSRVKSLNIQNFCVMLSPRNLPRQAISDIGWFMKEFANRMKSVDLTFWLINSSSYLMLANIFNQLPVIEEMILKVTISHDSVQWPSPLHTVRKIGFKTVDLSSSRCVQPQLVLNLMRLFPNTECLTIFPPKFGCYALNCLSEKMLQLSRLTEVHLWLDEASVEKSVKILEQLTRLPNNLEVLNLEYIPVLDENVAIALGKVMQRYAPTLTKLRLETLSVGMDRKELLEIHFPRFPVLMRLKLRLGCGMESDEALKPPNIKFSSDIISYGDDFPMLEDLEVHADFGNLCPTEPYSDNFAESFIPLGSDDRKQFVRMKRAEINIPDEWIKPGNLEWGRKFLNKFQQIFPNASLIPMAELVGKIQAGLGTPK